MKITYKMVKPMNVRSRLLSYNKKHITNINMKTLKLLIKSVELDRRCNFEVKRSKFDVENFLKYFYIYVNTGLPFIIPLGPILC